MKKTITIGAALVLTACGYVKSQKVQFADIQTHDKSKLVVDNTDSNQPWYSTERKGVLRYNLFTRMVVVDISYQQAAPTTTGISVLTSGKNYQVKIDEAGKPTPPSPPPEPKLQAAISTFDKTVGVYDVIYEDNILFSDTLNVTVDQNGFLNNSEISGKSDLSNILSDMSSIAGGAIKASSPVLAMAQAMDGQHYLFDVSEVNGGEYHIIPVSTQAYSNPPKSANELPLAKDFHRLYVFEACSPYEWRNHDSIANCVENDSSLACANFRLEEDSKHILVQGNGTEPLNPLAGLKIHVVPKLANSNNTGNHCFQIDKAIAKNDFNPDTNLDLALPNWLNDSKPISGLLAYYPQTKAAVVTKEPKDAGTPPVVAKYNFVVPTFLHSIDYDRNLLTSPDIGYALSSGFQTGYHLTNTGLVKGFFDFVTTPVSTIFGATTPPAESKNITTKVTVDNTGKVTKETDTTLNNAQ